MFIGIIKRVGEIKKIENKNSGKYFTILVKDFLRGIKIGGSISCNGACLTVIKKTKDSFMVELMAETLKLTSFKDSKIGDLINLEPAMSMGGKIDGHFVLGHIDGTGKIIKITRTKSNAELKIKVPKKLVKYLAHKGSVSVNGVSLTISGIDSDWFKVSLISYTLKNTNLSKINKGDKVNIEVDVIARYLERLLKNIV